MTDAAVNRGRFQRGKSGNPSGRPRKQREPTTSPFSIVMDRTLPFTREGEPTEISVEEALQRKTLQEALNGKRLAMRQVLGWIEKRERWRAKRAPRALAPAPVRQIVQDPRNADEAMLLLGIVTRDARRSESHGRDFLLLEPWAVSAALRRSGSRTLTQTKIDEIRRCTRDATSLRLPEPDEP